MLQKFLKENPGFKSVFAFKEFNKVQKQCFPKIMNSQDNMVVSAPTSAGKTVLFQLSIVKMIMNSQNKCLYLAPIKSLCHEKANSWKQKFMSKLHVLQLTGDSLEMDSQQLDHSNLIIATPQKIDYLSRQNLDALKSLSVLLIDEIHMLNMEERGATLEAIVSRIISINPKIRIIAVSATIPNIQQVGQWLKVPKHLICVFGQQFRPAKLNKVVLGFKSNGNDFNFEKMLNFKILDIIRNYSCGGGTLIFCQTQKGTEEACQKIISTMNQRQFLQSDGQLLSLVQSSKIVDNPTLKTMLPQGVAFHNAGLSMKDRSTVQRLFLQFKIKVLCTTSTLAMGINLPARLVIIKSTKCYRGSAKGYQQYTQIQMDQMMGRAGRVPYDIEGTVVIMTQKNNYNKYLGKTCLQNLESQLFNKLIQHLNTQISLKSIQSFNQACMYIQNSFFYIRMMNSPKQYGLNSNKQVPQFIKNTSINLIKKLSKYQIISFTQETQKVSPKQLSINLSKNAIEINTMIQIIDSMSQILTERQFLITICSSNELSKFRSKLDQRKVLKELNQKNKYSIKQAISNYQRKCFVLVQAQLSGIFIQNWQMRRQSGQIIYFLKRLVYCIKSMAYQKKSTFKTFWIFCFSQLFMKYFSLKFWDLNDQQILKQFTNVGSKWKALSARGITNLDQLKSNLDKIDSFCQKGSIFSKKIQEDIQSLTEGLQISIQPLPNKDYKNSTGKGLKIVYNRKFERLKSISISVQSKDQIYHQKVINQQFPQFFVVLRDCSSKKYFISIIKQGFIGFDQFYWIQNGHLAKTDFKKEEKQDNIIHKQKKQSLQMPNKKNHSNLSIQKKKKKNSQSLQISNSRQILKKYAKKPNQRVAVRQIKYNKNAQHSPKKQMYQTLKNQQNQEHSSTIKRTKQLKITDNYETVKFKKSLWQDEQNQNQHFSKRIKQNNKSQKFGDLKSYNWKSGFQPILDIQQRKKATKNQGQLKKSLLLASQSNAQTSDYSAQPDRPSDSSDIRARLNMFMNKGNSTNINQSKQIANRSNFDKYPRQIKCIANSQAKKIDFYTQNQGKFEGNYCNQFQSKQYNDNLRRKEVNILNLPHKQEKTQVDNSKKSSLQKSEHQNVYDYFNNLF